MIPVRQSTAFETAIGPVLDADGVAVTGGVVGDFKIKKTSGNFAALNGSATLTHVSAGFYDLVLTTSDVDTVGTCCIAIDDTTNACAPLYLQVLEEAVYDAIYAASAVGYVADQPVNTTKVSGTTQTARDIGASVLLSSGTGTGQLDFTSGVVKANVTQLLGTAWLTPGVAGTPDVNTKLIGGSATPVTNIGVVFNTDFATNYNTTIDMWNVNVENWNTTAVPAEHTAGYPIVTVKDGTGTGEINTNGGAIALVDLVTLTSTLTTYTGNTVQTGDSYGIVNSGTHGNAVIKGYVDDIGTAGAGLTAVPWNVAWDTEVQSEVQDAIEANHLDHFIAVADPGGIVANSSFLAKLVSKSATPAFSSYDNTTDSHEAIRDRGDAAWITATGFSTLDAAGVRTAVGLASANLDTQLSTIDDFLDTEIAAILAAVDTEVAAIKAKTDNLPSSFPTNFGSMTISAGGVVSADAVAISGDSTAADNLESYLDGTNFMPVDAHKPIFSIAAATLTVKKPDGTTTAYTRTLTTDAAADPVTGSS